MILRQGRHQARNLYIQMGDEPADEDEYVGVFFDPMRAEAMCQIFNDHRECSGSTVRPGWPR